MGTEEAMKHAATRELYTYWDRLRGSRLAPERAEIDPSAISRLLGDTFIIEIDEERTYPFRLAGTRLCALLGHELRGESALDLFSGADRTEFERLIDAVSLESASIVAGLDLRSNQSQRIDAEMLLLPLRHRGDGNLRVLGVLSPSEQPYWLGVCPIETSTIQSIRILWPSDRSAFEQHVPALRLPQGARRLAHLTIIDGGRS